MRRAQLSVALIVTLGALAACNEVPGGENGEDQYAPPPCPACAPTPGYPGPPYGFSPGATLQDESFQGFADPQTDHSSLQILKISDFFNPHVDEADYQPLSAADDDRLFPPKSIYGAGTKKPRVLLVDFGSGWCGPCNAEAKSLLDGLYAMYKPCGGGFFYQLADGVMMGTAVTDELLQTWSSVYKVSYPITFDNGHALGPFYSAGFPAGVIVDTSTMVIVEAISGVPDNAFWQTFESKLEPGCLQGG
jgi:thiol-disulfide isomerase/thioredoxin